MYVFLLFNGYAVTYFHLDSSRTCGKGWQWTTLCGSEDGKEEGGCGCARTKSILSLCAFCACYSSAVGDIWHKHGHRLPGAKCHGGTTSDPDTSVKEWRNLQPCGSLSPWPSVSWPPTLLDVLRLWTFVFLEHLIESSAVLPLCLHIGIWPLPPFFTFLQDCLFVTMEPSLYFNEWVTGRHFPSEKRTWKNTDD